MAPKPLNFRLSIPSEFRDTWDSFSNKAKKDGISPAELLRNLIGEHLENYEEESDEESSEEDENFDESAILAELTGTQVSGMPESVEKDEPVAKKVVIKKPASPKKKSFLDRKATITKKKAIPDDDDEISIQETPKFRLLELVRSLDNGEGIAPDSLVSAAEDKGIPNPRLQMNKMIRRGILYVHLDRVHVT